MVKYIICGTKRKGDFILGWKDSNTYHRIPAKSLLEAKAKMLKGTRYTFQDIRQLKADKIKIKPKKKKAFNPFDFGRL